MAIIGRARGRVRAMTLAEKAAELARLHADPELLVMVNVWDVASATVVAGLPGCRALATASHSIAASRGYPDGEAIPLDTMISAIGEIAAAVELPVSADLEAGYGDARAAVRRAIAAGAVGGNLEDEMKPLGEAVAAVEAAVSAGEAEGVPFVLNARTDAYLRGGDRHPADVLADAVARGRAFLDAGATCVFVPGRLDEPAVRALADAFGPGRLSVIAVPGSLPQATLAALGVARVSFGPWTQRVALTALADTGADLLAGGSLPEGVRALS
jgi:2-methylisocitrate lyase-like PEP mutase family enzyme